MADPGVIERIMNEEDHPPPTEQEIKDRLGIKDSFVFRAECERWWGMLKKNKAGLITQHTYQELCLRIHFVAAQDTEYSFEDLDEDWRKDSGGGEGLDAAQLWSSLFELADMWVDSCKKEHYVEFLRGLWWRICPDDDWGNKLWWGEQGWPEDSEEEEDDEEEDIEEVIKERRKTQMQIEEDSEEHISDSDSEGYDYDAYDSEATSGDSGSDDEVTKKTKKTKKKRKSKSKTMKKKSHTIKVEVKRKTDRNSWIEGYAADTQAVKFWNDAQAGTETPSPRVVGPPSPAPGGGGGVGGAEGPPATWGSILVHPQMAEPREEIRLSTPKPIGARHAGMIGAQREGTRQARNSRTGRLSPRSPQKLFSSHQQPHSPRTKRPVSGRLESGRSADSSQEGMLEIGGVRMGSPSKDPGAAAQELGGNTTITTTTAATEDKKATPKHTMFRESSQAGLEQLDRGTEGHRAIAANMRLNPKIGAELLQLQGYQYDESANGPRPADSPGKRLSRYNRPSAPAMQISVAGATTPNSRGTSTPMADSVEKNIGRPNSQPSTSIHLEGEDLVRHSSPTSVQQSLQSSSPSPLRRLKPSEHDSLPGASPSPIPAEGSGGLATEVSFTVARSGGEGEITLPPTLPPKRGHRASRTGMARLARLNRRSSFSGVMSAPQAVLDAAEAAAQQAAAAAEAGGVTGGGGARGGQGVMMMSQSASQSSLMLLQSGQHSGIGAAPPLPRLRLPRASDPTGGRRRGEGGESGLQDQHGQTLDMEKEKIRRLPRESKSKKDRVSRSSTSKDGEPARPARKSRASNSKKREAELGVARGGEGTGKGGKEGGGRGDEEGVRDQSRGRRGGGPPPRIMAVYLRVDVEKNWVRVVIDPHPNIPGAVVEWVTEEDVTRLAARGDSRHEGMPPSRQLEMMHGYSAIVGDRDVLQRQLHAPMCGGSHAQGFVVMQGLSEWEIRAKEQPLNHLIQERQWRRTMIPKGPPFSQWVHPAKRRQWELQEQEQESFQIRLGMLATNPSIIPPPRHHPSPSYSSVPQVQPVSCPSPFASRRSSQVNHTSQFSPNGSPSQVTLPEQYQDTLGAAVDAAKHPGAEGGAAANSEGRANTASARVQVASRTSSTAMGTTTTTTTSTDPHNRPATSLEISEMYPPQVNTESGGRALSPGRAVSPGREGTARGMVVPTSPLSDDHNKTFKPRDATAKSLESAGSVGGHGGGGGVGGGVGGKRAATSDTTAPATSTNTTSWTTHHSYDHQTPTNSSTAAYLIKRESVSSGVVSKSARPYPRSRVSPNHSQSRSARGPSSPTGAPHSPDPTSPPPGVTFMNNQLLAVRRYDSPNNVPRKSSATPQPYHPTSAQYHRSESPMSDSKLIRRPQSYKDPGSHDLTGGQRQHQHPNERIGSGGDGTSLKKTSGHHKIPTSIPASGEQLRGSIVPGSPSSPRFPRVSTFLKSSRGLDPAEEQQAAAEKRSGTAFTSLPSVASTPATTAQAGGNRSGRDKSGVHLAPDTLTYEKDDGELNLPRLSVISNAAPQFPGLLGEGNIPASPAPPPTPERGYEDADFQDRQPAEDVPKTYTVPKEPTRAERREKIKPWEVPVRGRQPAFLKVRRPQLICEENVGQNIKDVGRIIRGPAVRAYQAHHPVTKRESLLLSNPPEELTDGSPKKKKRVIREDAMIHGFAVKFTKGVAPSRGTLI